MNDGHETLNAFDIDGSDILVWAFKKSIREKQPVYNGRWIGTTQEVDAALKGALKEARHRITETLEYGLLVQNNEGSALAIGVEETYAPYVVAQAADPLPQRRVKKLKDIANAAFYAVKYMSGGNTVFAVRQTDASWRTRRALDMVSVVYQEDRLALDARPRFSLSKHFDFLIIGGTVLILSKGRFESLLNYKTAHIEDFSELQSEAEFAAAFGDMQPLIDYIGSNKVQLRRASAIRQKGHYKDAAFMNRLRTECAALGFNISFDKDGRIMATVESCRDIVQALLDHRLDSRLSRRLYDVENTLAVET